MPEYRVIVVDDDVMILKSIRNLLSEHNIKVNAVRSGMDLLAFMENNSPDLILLDIMMPDMDGFEVLDRLRLFEKNAGRRTTPVIFLTGDNDSEAERKGLEQGAADFVVKPFDQNILIQRITNTIKNSKTIENLTEEASVDKLTGLYNKATAEEKLTEACSMKTGAMMIIDLDNFKLVNDIYGHDMGDRVLTSFADITRNNTRAEDVLCRIGGDEFMAFCNNATSPEAVAAFTKRLNKQLFSEAKELMGENFNIPLGVSVGAVFVPEHGRDYRTLFNNADKALYKVKQNGKHDCAVYDPVSYDDAMELENPGLELARITKVLKERGETDMAMIVGQDALMWIYRFINRMPGQYGRNTVSLLFSLSRSLNGRKEVFDDAVNLFKEVLQNNLGRSDIIMQGKTNRFFILLTDIGEDPEQYADVVINNILTEWNSHAFKDDMDVAWAVENDRKMGDKEVTT